MGAQRFLTSGSSCLVRHNRRHQLCQHAGIVLRQRGETFLIHVVTGEGGPNITKVESIHDFLRSDRATAAIAYRIVEENPLLIAPVAEAARNYAERQVPFDSDFDLTGDRALYCTSSSGALTKGWRRFG